MESLKKAKYLNIIFLIVTDRIIMITNIIISQGIARDKICQ